MPQAEYTVRLDAFEGPLDLLLFLIRRAEVEITDIPIASITEQYLKHIEHLGVGATVRAGERLDIERAGEFLVMAATLMEIKSRTLAPMRSGEAGGESADAASAAPGQRIKEIDPRAELVEQLLEYKRFRDASSQLEHQREQWHARYPSGRALAGAAAPEDAVPAPAEETGATPVEIDDLTLVDLVEAFAKIIESVDFSRVGEHRVVMDDTPVEVHAEDIIERLRRAAEDPPAGSGLSRGEMEFASLFEDRSRPEMIGLFLALLELVKQQRIGLRQDAGDSSGRRIVLRLADEAPDVGASAPPTPSGSVTLES